MDPIEAQIDNIIEATTQDIEETEEVDKTEETEHSDSNSEDEAEEEDEEITDKEQGSTAVNTAVTAVSSVVDSENIEVFNVALHQYLQIDEEVKALLEAIKIRNKKKKQLSDSLGEYLRANQIRNVNLGGSYKGKKLETKVTYSNKGFSKQTVTEAIYNELKEEEEVFEKIMESISRTNVITEKWNLRIVNEKSIKGKSKIEKAKSKIDIAEELLNEDD